MKRKQLKTIVCAAGLGIALAPGNAAACSVCFGNPDSLQTKGMAMGILFLLAVILSVLMGISAFFIYVAKKSHASDNAAEASPAVSASKEYTQE